MSLSLWDSAFNKAVPEWKYSCDTTVRAFQELCPMAAAFAVAYSWMLPPFLKLSGGAG